MQTLTEQGGQILNSAGAVMKELKKVMREAYKIVEKLEIKYSLKRQEFLNAIEIEDTKYSALSTFSRVMTSKRGNPTPEEIEAFLSTGYTENHILGVIAGIGIKTMSNYFNHVFNTPVDDAFKGRTWSKSS